MYNKTGVAFLYISKYLTSSLRMSSSSSSSLSKKEEDIINFFKKHNYTLQDEHGKNVGDNHYQKAKLGRGAFGTVYRVAHKLERQPYAIKLIDKSKMAKERKMKEKALTKNIEKEIKALARVNNPAIGQLDDSGHVVKYYSSVSDESYMLIQMELCKESVEDYYKRNRHLFTPFTIRKYLLQVANGLKYLHSKSIVHRDLKQDNICFGRDGKLKLVDLGLAAQFEGPGMNESRKKSLEQTRGNEYYRAPESIKIGERVDGKADVWSLGLIVAEWLCNSFIYEWPKYEGNHANENEKMRKDIIKCCKDQDQILGRFVQRMLAKNKNRRLGSDKLVDQLRKYGLKEIKGKVVDEGFAPPVSKEWIKNLYKREVKKLSECLKSIDKDLTLDKEIALAFARRKSKEQRKGLTVDEVAAIHLYTQDALYKHLNETLRKDNDEREKVLDISRLILSGLDKLPYEDETTFYRVVTKKLKNYYKRGYQFFEAAFSSCSTNGIDVLERFARPQSWNTIFVITGRGKSIKEFSHKQIEDEILVPMGVELRVENFLMDNHSQKYFVSLKIMDSIRPSAGSKKRKREENEENDDILRLEENNKTNGGDPFIVACEFDKIKDVQTFINYYDSQGNKKERISEIGKDSHGTISTALMSAAFEENERVVKLLLDNDVDVTIEDANGYNVLHWVVVDAESSEFVEELLKHKEICKLVNKTDHEGFTPLDHVYAELNKGNFPKDRLKARDKLFRKYKGEAKDKSHFKSYDDLSEYKGGINSRGKREGYGIYELADGRKFEGNWKNDKRQGKGSEFNRNGILVYEGDWENNKYHGQGKYIFPNGNIYEGGFKNGKSDGFGTQKDTNGEKYEGYWRKEKRHGNGKSYKNGKLVYEGGFENGYMHGKGTFFVDSNGHTYKGDFEKDESHGYGIKVATNGDKYEGDWQRDHMHGKGIYTYANGDEYEGDFVDDKFHGKGKLNKADGTVEDGNWDHDVFKPEA